MYVDGDDADWQSLVLFNSMDGGVAPPGAQPSRPDVSEGGRV